MPFSSWVSSFNEQRYLLFCATLCLFIFYSLVSLYTIITKFNLIDYYLSMFEISILGYEPRCQKRKSASVQVSC